MGLAHAFNSAITPQVEQKKSTKRNKPATNITSLGMEINDFKEAYFNFDMKRFLIQITLIWMHQWMTMKVG
jgi:hypothetical protein